MTSFFRPSRLGSRWIFSGSVPARTAGGRVRQGGGGAGGDQAPPDLQQLGQAIAGLLHQLVQIDVKMRRLFHRVDHLRQHQRAAIDGERRGAVDERLDADARVDFRTRFGDGCRGACAAMRSAAAVPACKSRRG